MAPYSLIHGSALRPLGSFGHLPSSSSRASGASSRCSTRTAATASSYMERVQGFQGPWKAACTSGVLSALGDSLAQTLGMYMEQKEGRANPPYNPWRTLRMFGFGFCWYGPYQFYWYNMLEWAMPLKTTLNFLAKVASNQLLLAPCTVSGLFAWNLCLAGKAEELPNKMKADLVPTMMNGWKFWVPAASLNFYCIPIQLQVLYMSCCGVLWTAYLSYASTTPQGATAAPVVAKLEAATTQSPAAKTDKKHKKK